MKKIKFIIVMILAGFYCLLIPYQSALAEEAEVRFIDSWLAY